jgi:hypothetical protein
MGTIEAWKRRGRVRAFFFFAHPHAAARNAA